MDFFFETFCEYLYNWTVGTLEFASSVAGLAEHTVICVNGPCTDGQRVIAMLSPLVINPKQTEPPCIMDTN